MIIRPYDSNKDKEAAHRIWKEVHWIKKDQEELMDHFLEACNVQIAEIAGNAECLVASSPGSIRYLKEDLSLSAIAAVTTSRVARKQGLARRLTAKVLADDVARGAHVSALGMFEQGYYNQLGFGTGRYEHMLRLDPADLIVKQSFRVPQRLSKDDWEMIHQAALARRRGHGACNLFHSGLTRAELGWTDSGFGLGYTEGSTLTHFFWASGEEEHGPYTLGMLIYQTHEQLLELLALVKSLGDQIRVVSIFEPVEIQIQDLIRQPFRGRMTSKKSEYEQRHVSHAFWQFRICDLFACLEKTHIPSDSLRFNLHLQDPIENILDASASWRGISGDYIVTLGPQSFAETGTASDLPILEASVGAFSRLWLGIRPATGLAVTDDLEGPQELLEALDELLRLPPAQLGWDF